MEPDEQISRHYKGRHGAAYHEKKHGIPEISYPWVGRIRASKFTSHIRAQDVVLEYGVGTGWNISHIRCRRKMGYDITESLAPVLDAQDIQFIQDVSVLEDGFVDVLICHHVLEHLAQPLGALEQMHRLLKTGGRLLLVVPYERERKYRMFEPDEPNHHLFSWNAQTLGNLVTEAGFKITSGRISRYGYDRFSAVLAARFKLGEMGFRVIRKIGQWGFPLYEVNMIAEKKES